MMTANAATIRERVQSQAAGQAGNVCFNYCSNKYTESKTYTACYSGCIQYCGSGNSNKSCANTCKDNLIYPSQSQKDACNDGCAKGEQKC